MKKILLLLAVLAFTGCAVGTRYVPYTDQRFAPKPKYYFITVYYSGQQPPSTQPYYVIGRVEVSGHASDGVNPEELSDKAKAVARKKGADAIINAKSENIGYNGVDVIPGHMSYRTAYYGRHERVYVGRYHPTTYLPYSDVLLTFRGELIVFKNEPPPEK